MKELIFKTNRTVSPLLLRLTLAVVLFPHGAQKLLGWFGGPGFNGAMNYLTVTRGLPPILGFAVIFIEFFGPLAILLGFATRIWSIAIAVLMTGIILTTFTDYFFMNWFGNHTNEGMEFFLLMIGLSLSLVVSGAGILSIDAWMERRTKTVRKEGKVAAVQPQ